MLLLLHEDNCLWQVYLFMKLLLHLNSETVILISVFCAKCWLSARLICCLNTIPLLPIDSWPGDAHPAPISIQLWLLCSP